MIYMLLTYNHTIYPSNIPSISPIKSIYQIPNTYSIRMKYDAAKYGVYIDDEYGTAKYGLYIDEEYDAAEYEVYIDGEY